MHQSVQIVLQSVQRPIITEGREAVPWDSPQCQQMGTKAIGEYYRKGDSHYCLYEEQPEGWDQPARTMLKWRGHTIELQRRGAMAARMVFEPGNSYCSPYRTPYGEMLMETETRMVRVRETTREILLVVEYGLKLDRQPVSENRIEIHIQYI